MRVVAGEFKGRKLVGPRGTAARPTSDKVREAIFSIVGPPEGLNVLDLFAGTGALGIEALSRGAAHVAFVERDRNMRAVIKSNLQVTAGDDAQHVTLHAGDAVKFLERAAAAGDSFELVLLDPPYADAERLLPALAETLPAVLSSGATIVAESDRRAPLLLETSAPQSFSLQSERKYGDTLVRVLRFAGTSEAE